MVKKVKQSPIEQRIIKIENEFSIKNAGEITRNLQKNIRNARAALIKLERIGQFDLSAIQVIQTIRKYADQRIIELKVGMQLQGDIKTFLSNTGFNDFC